LQHPKEVDHELALLPSDHGVPLVEVLKSKAEFVDLRAEEAKEGLRWDGIVIVMIRGLFLLL